MWETDQHRKTATDLLYAFLVFSHALLLYNAFAYSFAISPPSKGVLPLPLLAHLRGHAEPSDVKLFRVQMS